MTFIRHSWPLNIEHCLTCHTYCDTGKPFVIVIFEDPLVAPTLAADSLAVELPLQGILFDTA